VEYSVSQLISKGTLPLLTYNLLLLQLC